MDITSISKPIAVICLCTVIILAGIGIFIPNYTETHDCDALILRDFQVESVSLKGMNSFTISGTYLGDDIEQSYEMAEGYKESLQFLIKGSSVSGRIENAGLIGGEDGETIFLISGSVDRLIFPGEVRGFRFAGKRVEF